MPSLREKPTNASIEQEVGYLTSLWSEAHARWREYDDYVDRRFRVWDKNPNRPSYRPATASRIINQAVNAQLGFVPTITRVPVRDNSESETWANSVEASLNAIVTDSLFREPSLPTKELNRNLVQYGYAVLMGPMLDSAMMGEKPEEPDREDFDSDDEFALAQSDFKASARHWNPIYFDVPHPTEVLIDPKAKRVHLAIRLFTMTVQDLVDFTQAKKDVSELDGEQIRDVKVYKPSPGERPSENVELVERWTRWWHTIKLSTGEILVTEKNTWGFVPARHAYSGWGRRNTRGRGFNYARSMAMGILEDLISTEGAASSSIGSLKAEAQNFTAKHTILINHAYRPMGTTGDSADVAEQIGRGEMLEGDADMLWIADFPEVSRQLFQTGIEIGQDIEQATLTQAIAGQRPVGVSTVGQQQQITTAGQRQFASIARKNEQLWADAIGDLLKLAHVTEDTYSVNGKALLKRHIENSFVVSVTFEELDPAIQIARRQQGMQEVQSGIKSIQTFWEQDANLQNTTEEQKRLDREWIRNWPELREIYAQQVADEEGIGDEFQEARELRRRRETQAPNADIVDTTGSREGRQMLNAETINPARNGING